jgi:hypothetical protein
MAYRKLKHYFQAHKIIIPSSVPLNNIFKNLDAIGRIGKWATEINDFVIEFIGRNTIKSQAIVDFVTDWTPTPITWRRSQNQSRQCTQMGHGDKQELESRQS